MQYSYEVQTTINRLGETVTYWMSHKHPDNPNFMQVVKWRIYEKDGSMSCIWNLYNNAPNDYHRIKGMTKSEIIEKYTDAPELEITEEEFQAWLDKQIKG